mgnify:CR=1 FL=1
MSKGTKEKAGILAWLPSEEDVEVEESNEESNTNAGGNEDEVELECHARCSERYPILNQYTQIFYLMCMDECRQELRNNK